MALRRATSRIGLFTLLLSVIALSLFGSLVAADRALQGSQQRLADLDARSSAAAVARDLRLRADALTEFFDPLLAAPAANIQPPEDFDAAWVLDPAGRVVYAHPPAAAADTAGIAALARIATGSAWPAVGVSRHTPASLLLAVPLSHRGKHLGAAVGRLGMVGVLDAIRAESPGRSGLGIEMGGGIVARSGDVTGSGHRRADAILPVEGERMVLVVARREGGQGIRRVLWMLGVVALVALLAGLARERRQAVSLAARTAELERLYQEVARSNRMKSEFLANVSHELRTPLNAIVGFVEMLREGVYGEMTPRQALPVDRIAGSASHLRQLVDRLLDIAKIAAGRVEIQVEPLTLRALVLDVASEMESLVSESGLSLSIAVPQTLPRIHSDQTHLRQILINLIGNAVKYTPTGEVRVRAELLDAKATGAPERSATEAGAPPDGAAAWVALMVSDTGVGIAPEDQERIFDEFEQVNAGARTDSARRGTGLGLAISRRLARLLGGEITVSSNAGGGSIFTVWLPLESAPDGRASPEPPAPPRTPA